MGWAPNIAVSVAPAGVRPWLPGPSLHSTYNRPSLYARATHQCVQFSRETWRSVPRPSANAVVRPRTPTTLMRHLRRLSTLLSGYICMDLLSVEEQLRWNRRRIPGIAFVVPSGHPSPPRDNPSSSTLCGNASCLALTWIRRKDVCTG